MNNVYSYGHFLPILRGKKINKEFFRKKKQSNFAKFKICIFSKFYNKLQYVVIILKNLNKFPSPQLVYIQMCLNILNIS
jgi:hypothetical protein